MTTSKLLTIVPMGLLVFNIGCNQKEKTAMESNNSEKTNPEMEITDEQLDHLGITNRDYLSAASKRALQWPTDLGNEWFIEFSSPQPLKGDLAYELEWFVEIQVHDKGKWQVLCVVFQKYG